MKALILAAGQGRRLWPFTATIPKCLLLVDNQSILEHQLAALEHIGIKQVVIVCGYGARAIRQVTNNITSSLELKLLFNPFYQQSDNFISLWAARSEMDQDFILCNGDNVFDPNILETLMSAPSACALMTQRKRNYTSEDMMVYYVKDRIRHIGKHLVPHAADAISIGLMRFSSSSVPIFRDILEERAKDDHVMQSYFLAAVQSLIDAEYPVCGRDIGDRFWIDVDTPSDLANARYYMAKQQTSNPPLCRYATVQGQA